MEIGEFIKSKRNEKGISLRGMASKVEISHPYLSQIENNLRKASPELLDKISPIIDVSHNELMKIAGYIHEKKGIEEKISNYTKLIRELKNAKDIARELNLQISQRNPEIINNLYAQKKEILAEIQDPSFEESNKEKVNTKEQISLLEKQITTLKKVEEIDDLIQRESIHLEYLKHSLSNEKQKAESIKKALIGLKKEIEEFLDTSFQTAMSEK